MLEETCPVNAPPAPAPAAPRPRACWTPCHCDPATPRAHQHRSPSCTRPPRPVPPRGPGPALSRRETVSPAPLVGTRTMPLVRERTTATAPHRPPVRPLVLTAASAAASLAASIAWGLDVGELAAVVLAAWRLAAWHHPDTARARGRVPAPALVDATTVTLRPHRPSRPHRPRTLLDIDTTSRSREAPPCPPT
jgi:hypothetical protein